MGGAGRGGGADKGGEERMEGGRRGRASRQREREKVKYIRLPPSSSTLFTKECIHDVRALPSAYRACNHDGARYVDPNTEVRQQGHDDTKRQADQMPTRSWDSPTFIRRMRFESSFRLLSHLQRMQRVHRVAAEASSSASTISPAHEQHEQQQHASQRRRLDEPIAPASSAASEIHSSSPTRHHAADPQGTITASLFARLPADLCVGIVDHLDVFAICELSVVSREWFDRTNSDRVWKRLCVERWRGKRHHPDVDSVCAQFPRRPLIAPIQYGFTTAAAIASASASASIPPSSASSSSAISHPSALPGALTLFDAGTLVSNSWRRAYEFAELDRHRADMTPDELFSLHWLFIFKGDAHSIPVRVRFALIDRGTDGTDLAEAR
jgi:hypothetical protein